VADEESVPSCSSCRYESGARCHRYAPRPQSAVADETWTRWPLVLNSDWCGEYESK